MGLDNLVEGRSEWIHEREWRVHGSGDPPVFSFSYDEVAFLLLPDLPTHQWLCEEVVATAYPTQVATLRAVPVVFAAADGSLDDASGVWIR